MAALAAAEHCVRIITKKRLSMGWIIDILKEIPSVARYKSELEKTERENAQLKQEIITLESENQNLRQEIQRRNKIIQKEKSHSGFLDKEKINILLYLHKHLSDSLTFHISQALNMSETITKYHLQGLHKINFIKQGLPDKPGRPWHIADKGIKYLIENKFIF